MAGPDRGCQVLAAGCDRTAQPGRADIFIACVDGLKGASDAIEAVFPKAVVQLCIVHMVRHSLNYVSWKRRKGGWQPTCAASTRPPPPKRPS